MDKPKSYAIPKWLVYNAYERVKVRRGAAGVDGESLRTFEEDLKNNLYKKSGTGCRRGVTFRRQSRRWKFPILRSPASWMPPHPPFDFLSFTGRPLCAPKSSAVEKFKDRIQGLTRRTRPMTVTTVIRDLAPVIRGWGAYFAISHAGPLLERRLFRNLAKLPKQSYLQAQFSAQRKKLVGNFADNIQAGILG